MFLVAPGILAWFLRGLCRYLSPAILDWHEGWASGSSLPYFNRGHEIASPSFFSPALRAWQAILFSGHWCPFFHF
ncbi:hypothetical protein QBC34DRAFT_412528 [Podospora aff. communis PSN243]|uniref:Secreted protein n=1 Tax=Podospora aff. communis PSN243 TaxID=3040156 RepID=A0AAV9GFC4_9PEZI|nr:hypothetical protein QBC34DRAFT_412528 [Podospora aff. communis PSN243]